MGTRRTSGRTIEQPDTWPRLDPFRALAPVAERNPGASDAPATGYRRLFAIDELERSAALQWFLGAILLGFFVTFSEWSTNPAITAATAASGKQVCWPHLPHCGDFYVLNLGPNGASQMAVYMALFTVIAVAAFALWRRRFVLAHACVVVLFLFKVLVFYGLTMELKGKYHVEHMFATFVLLFARHKFFYLRRAVVFIYLAACALKLQDGWVLGTFFTSGAGLPLAPAVLVPILTNVAIVLQLVGGPLLLSRHYVLQRVALGGLLGFHLYSGLILQSFSFPAIMVPTLLILFGPPVIAPRLVLGVRDVAGTVILLAFTACQSVSFVIPGDARYTNEGTAYGTYVFFANRACRWDATVQRKDGPRDVLSGESRPHHDRCDPYVIWQRVQAFCARRLDPTARVHLVFDQSVNGGPVYRIIDEPDACTLAYHAGRHNAWIKDPAAGAPIVADEALGGDDDELMGRGGNSRPAPPPRRAPPPRTTQWFAPYAAPCVRAYLALWLWMAGALLWRDLVRPLVDRVRQV